MKWTHQGIGIDVTAVRSLALRLFFFFFVFFFSLFSFGNDLEHIAQAKKNVRYIQNDLNKLYLSHKIERRLQTEVLHSVFCIYRFDEKLWRKRKKCVEKTNFVDSEEKIAFMIFSYYSYKKVWKFWNGRFTTRITWTMFYVWKFARVLNKVPAWSLVLSVFFLLHYRMLWCFALQIDEMLLQQQQQRQQQLQNRVHQSKIYLFVWIVAVLRSLNSCTNIWIFNVYVTMKRG